LFYPIENVGIPQKLIREIRHVLTPSLDLEILGIFDL
jgi:hypothetical protein